jgi:hypothetical protein
MRRSFLSTLAGFALALALAGPAVAQSAFDGNWSVDLTVQRGSGAQCDDEGRSFPIRVQGGRISYGGNLDLNASGQIGADGRVQARFSRGSDSLNANGRATGDSASGRFNSPSRGCAGTFRARRISR